MLTKNNFTTEAIVAKYVTAVKDLANERGINTKEYEFAVKERESFSPHQQLVAKLWFDHEGCPTEHPFLAEISKYKNSFKKSLITDEEYSFLLENYKETIEYLFSERKNWSFNLLTGHDQPEELIELVTEFLTLKEGQSIFLPFCSYGDVAIKFPQCKISGFVTDPLIEALTRIRLDAIGISENIYTLPYEFEKSRCVLPKEKVDAIVLDGRFMNPLSALLENYIGFDVEDMYKMLKEDGQIIATCSYHTLKSIGCHYNGQSANVLEEKAIKEIIQLPEEIYSGSKNKNFLVHIVKNASENGFNGILMFNASNASRVCSVHPAIKRIDVEGVLHTIKHFGDDENKDVIRHIPYKDVDSEILIPEYYLLNRDYKSSIRLTDLVDYDNGYIDGAPEGRQYNLSCKSELSTDFKGARLTVERIFEPSETFDDPDKYYGNFYKAEPCIFLAIVDGKVAVAYSGIEDKDAFYRVGTVMCLKVKEGISVEYVAALLFSEPIQKQLIAMGAGSGGRIDPCLLAKVLVPDLSKEDMFEYLGSVLKASLVERENEMKLERQTYERNIRLRKHALTQSVSAFGAMFNTLNKCRVRQGGILHDEDKISPVSDKTVAEVFDTLSVRMSAILEKLAHIADVDIDFGEPEIIDPEDFILQYIKSKKSGWINFEGETSWDSSYVHNKNRTELRDPENNRVIMGVGDTIHSFSFPKAALEHVFNNIIANAIAHGFADESRTDYKVRFSWESQGLYIVISIENNGIPLPEGVNSKDILSYGYSTKLNVDGHNGIGGSEIASIMQDFQGEVEVQSCPDAEYPVKYILRFHNSNIVGTLKNEP